MSTFLDPDTVAHGIQLSIAPVFLLTAVAGMIGAVSNRLARIIDRARFIEARLKTERDSEPRRTGASWLICAPGACWPMPALRC